MGQVVGGVVGEGVWAPEVVGAPEGMGQAVGGVVVEAQVLGGHEDSVEEVWLSPYLIG